jgi:hypothetical protein
MLSIEQKKQLVESILILKGSINEEAILSLSDEAILKMLFGEVCGTMVSFWELVNKNRELQKLVNDIF